MRRDMPLSEQTMGKYFKNVNEAQSLCEALAAPARTEIMRLRTAPTAWTRSQRHCTYPTAR